MTSFPSDDVGEKINPALSFLDLFKVLDRRQDVYKALGVQDSVIREAVFEKLAEIMEAPYSEVYDQWLMRTRLQNN